MKAKSIEDSKTLTTNLLLKHILCIQYLVQFKKNEAKNHTLIDFGSKVNATTIGYIKKLGL